MLIVIVILTVKFRRSRIARHHYWRTRATFPGIRHIIRLVRLPEKIDNWFWLLKLPTGIFLEGQSRELNRIIIIPSKVNENQLIRCWPSSLTIFVALTIMTSANFLIAKMCAMSIVVILAMEIRKPLFSYRNPWLCLLEISLKPARKRFYSIKNSTLI